jgi:hypothetical protein
MVRVAGLVRIRDLHLPLLGRAGAPHSGAVTDARPVEVENLLPAAAGYPPGLAPGLRDTRLALPEVFKSSVSASPRRTVVPNGPHPTAELSDGEEKGHRCG